MGIKSGMSRIVSGLYTHALTNYEWSELRNRDSGERVISNGVEDGKEKGWGSRSAINWGNFLCYVERNLEEKSVPERGDRPNQASYGFVIWRISGVSKR